MRRTKKKLMWEEKVKRIFGFFVGKGLLGKEGTEPLPSAKLDINDVIKAGLEIEPRILEVLPAAMLRFPRSFLNWEKMPEKLATVLDCIKKNKNEGPDLGGLPYKDLKRWANCELPDKRTIPAKEKKIPSYFRLRPAAIEALKKRAYREGISEAEVIERLLIRQNPN